MSNDDFSFFISIFGMPFLSDPHDDVAYVQYILEQELQVNIASDDCTIIPEAELVLYLGAVNSRTVSVTPSTEELIKDYFVTCRRCREGKPTKKLNVCNK